MATDGAVLRVQGGVIQDIRPVGPDNAFVRALRGMLDDDPNYAKVHELGFGLNPCEGFFLYDNFLPNEMKLGVHFGLGLTPFTEFHLDLACTSIAVYAESGNQQKELFRTGALARVI